MQADLIHTDKTRYQEVVVDVSISSKGTHHPLSTGQLFPREFQISEHRKVYLVVAHATRLSAFLVTHH